MDYELIPTGYSMRALTEQYQTIAHNLSNVNSPGYRRRINTFSQILEQHSQGATPPEMESGIVEQTTSLDWTQGMLDNTGRTLDFGLVGKGFFTLETPDGPVYTRNGTFYLDKQSRLVDASGRLLAGQNGPITIPPGVSSRDISVGPDGTVLAGGTQIERVKIAEFDDNSVLVPVGDSAFVAPPDAAGQNQTTALHQGYRERANVETAQELINLITVSRLYESNLKMAKAQDQRMQTIIRAAMS
jgi:flagellar basal body rod protein FlgG